MELRKSEKKKHRRKSLRRKHFAENPSKNLSYSLWDKWLKLKWELLHKFKTTNN